MRNREAYWLATLPDITPSATLPKLIHQTYPTRQLPPPLARNVERMVALNPGWEHRLYDDAACRDLVASHYGEAVLRLFDGIRSDYGAARTDLFRYLAVYALGGVYLDIKSYFASPIDSVLAEGDRFVLSYWDNGPAGEHPGFGRHRDLPDSPRGEIQQWHVIAQAGHPYLRHVLARVLAGIETYRPWTIGVGKIGVLRLTGPIAYTRAIQPVLDPALHRLVEKPSDIGLHYSIADDYDHQAVFKRHYSLHTTPVARIPATAVPAATVYGWLKQVQRKVRERR